MKLRREFFEKYIL